MKKIINLLVAAVVFLCATSCISSEETDTSIFTDCAITSFSISDIETKLTAKDQSGEDSTYTMKVTGSAVAFTIDHLKREIYNTDSLPRYTDIKHVLCTIVSDGNTVYKNNNYDSTNSESAEWGATSDSIDFTKPVTFRVWAYNGQDYRDYEVRLNVHQCDSSETVWQKMANAYPGQELKQPRAITFGKKVAVFGMKNQVLHVTTADMGQQNWTQLAPVQGLTGKAQFTEITTFGNQLYIVDDQQLMVSADGVTWAAESANMDFSHLLGNSGTQLFAVNGEQFFVSTDGKNWEPEISEYAEMIPDTNIFSVHYPTSTNQQIERTVMMGQISESTDSIAPVWFRQGDSPWTFMQTSVNKAYFLPNMENLVILHYKNYLLALGGKIMNTRYPNQPLNGIYVSMDNGLTWKVQNDDEKYIYPTLSEELTGNAHPFAAYVDDDLYIWLLFSETGEVWRGRLNYITFAK